MYTSTTILFFQISSLENARNYKGTVGNDQNINIKPDCNVGGLVSCFKNDFFLYAIKCNLTKLTTKSSTDLQCGYL